MPVDFLTTEQELNYGRYIAESNEIENITKGGSFTGESE